MKKLYGSVLFTVLAAAISACGPEDTGINPGATCEPVANTDICEGGLDEDCDGFTDCSDPDCAGYPSCPPPCGTVTASDLELPLPDGPQPGDELDYFLGTAELQGFGAGATLQNAGDLLSACVIMEHSWIRDLQIEMVCPSGEIVVLQEFLGTTGGQVFLGEPIDTDYDVPQPGVGYEYCWTPTATNLPLLEYANANPGITTIPAGDYQPVGSFESLEGCTLDGAWSIKVTDLWGADNGYIFGWSLDFNPAIIQDCSIW
ncbi:MAG: hypothetical protein IPL79_19635 [Myxococcales bacterium]|nr:hypothetical protein [Myxococcales bacterium]